MGIETTPDGVTYEHVAVVVEEDDTGTQCAPCRPFALTALACAQRRPAIIRRMSAGIGGLLTRTAPALDLTPG